jgi:hypothetical protein
MATKKKAAAKPRKLTLQAMFNKVWRHFVVKKGKPSYDVEGGKGCMYRGPDGAMCAIGLCIPDKVYKPDMEGENVFGISKRPGIEALFGHIDLKDLAGLQDCHDSNTELSGAQFTTAMRRDLRCFAKIHGLKVPA